MRLTKKGHFAVTAMIHLALHGQSGPVGLGGVSVQEGISGPYLAKLLWALQRGGLVRSVRGPGGGYLLAKPADIITVADVVGAVGEPVEATQCQGKKNCRSADGRQGACLAHDLWAGLSELMQNYLDAVTLGDLVRRMQQPAAADAGLVGRSTEGTSPILFFP